MLGAMTTPAEMADLDRADVDARPTRARFAVLAFLCSLTFVLYLDRVCMGQAVKPIQDEMHLTNSQMGMVLMAFTLAYGLFEVPTGHLGDRYGSRGVLARIVIWWSVFTALTGAATGFYSLLAVRFLFGAGEAGAYPNAARVIARWFPPAERGRVQGLLMSFALVGGTVSPVAAGYLIDLWGWRWTFVAFGAVGVAWAVAFLGWFRDDPAAHPSVNGLELLRITDGTPPPPPAASAAHPVRFPWRQTFRDRNIWLLGLIMTCSAFTSYLYFSWYPKYLQEAYGLNIRQSGWLTSMVLGAGAVGTLGGGLLVDRAVRRGRDPVRARRHLGATALLLAAGLLLVSSRCEDPVLSAGLAAASCLAMLGQQSAWWSTATEVGGRHVGALFGLMNGMGIFGAMGSQYFFGAYADWRLARGFEGREMWSPAFLLYVALLVVGALCWFYVDPSARRGGRGGPRNEESDPSLIPAAKESR